MKTKLITWGAVALIILCLAAWGTNNRQKYVTAKAENIRFEFNQKQLLEETNQYKRLYVKKEEMVKSLTQKQDSLLKALKVKPKQVERIVESVHHEIDTTGRTQLLAINDSLLQVIENNQIREYPFKDVEGCFTFEGLVTIDNGLHLAVTKREYTNTSTEIAYIEREKKFLGIKYGRWRGKLYINNECGEDIVKELTVVK